MSNDVGYRPTPEQPLLVGLLVDVSASMATSIQNRTGQSQSRLESFRDALEDLVDKAKEMSRVESSEKIAPLIKIFAYGFGFGNPLSLLFGGPGPKVRDLLVLPGESTSTVSIDQLAHQWDDYRRHVEGMAREMFGDTPMGEGFRLVLDRFRRELASGRFTGPPVLFVLSDGEPTDVSSPEVVETAQEIKKAGVLLVSCYVTDEDIVEARRIYGAAQKNWPDDARLMFECSSVIDAASSFYSYLREFRWTVENNGRFFTQINQSEMLSEFMNAVLSPLKQPADALESAVAAKGPAGPGAAEQVDLVELRQLLASRFSLGELRNLCFDLEVDYEDLPGEGKAEKARELVGYLERRNRIADLLQVGRNLRPDVAWDDVLTAASSN